MSPHVIYVAGKLSDSTGKTIQMKAHVVNNATGTSNIFAGYGVLGQIYDNNSSQFARFHIQTDVVSNNLIEFTGNVTKSTDPNMIGSTISIIAEPLTGNMTLIFDGYSNYTGIGYISIR